MPTKNQIAATMSKSEASRHGVVVADNSGEIAEFITANSRKNFGFTRKQLPTGLPTEPKTYIFSVSGYGEIVNLGPGFPQYEVKACPEGDDYGEPLVIGPIHFFEEAKVDVTEHTFQSGAQIVDAILRIGPGMNAAWDMRKQGWFVSSTNPPSNAEVDRAVEVYTTECKRLIQIANGYFSRNQLNEINEIHRRAAVYLKQKVDWDKPTQKMVDCPGCGEAVRPNILWHATPHGCGYVFDPKEFAIRFPHNPLQAPHADAAPQK